MNDRVEIEVIAGSEGYCLVVDSHRVAGPKPWGGGRTVRKWSVSRADLLRAIKADSDFLSQALNEGDGSYRP
jgi:hypothetical protein